MLHVTNGHSVSLAETGLIGEVLVWRDSINGKRGAPPPLEALDRHDDIVLWFEHDLYDQAQLIELLAWLRGRSGIQLIQSSTYLGPMTADELLALWPERRRVSGAQFTLGAAAWAAFVAQDYAAVEALVAGDTSALPFLGGALRRWLEERPGRDGLGRTQRQILEIAAEGGQTFGALFGASQQREERIFLGDTQFEEWIATLTDAPVPLLRVEDGVYVLTEAGRDALAGRFAEE
ncbi:MAG: hypothetical protein ABI759_31465 [Candidatus Solibacter sp.]